MLTIFGIKIMSFKKLALAGASVAMLFGSTANASVIDSPFFQVLGVVVVWGGTSATDQTPIVNDFVLLTPASGSAGADLIGNTGDVDGYTIVTGSLDPLDGVGGSLTVTDNNSDGVLDAGDSLAAFGIDNTTDIDGLVGSHNSSFYVASNAAFDIYAEADPVVATGDWSGNVDLEDISYEFGPALTAGVPTTGTQGTVNYGANAQDPSSATQPTLATLDDVAGAPTKVFDGATRTASAVGSLASQSVRFDASYALDDGYDLSMGVGSVTTDVVYTIYVP